MSISLSTLIGITGHPFRSGNSNTITVTPNTATAFVTFASPTYNVDNWFDGTTGAFVPKTAGYYQINASVEYGNGLIASIASVAIYKNGSLFSNAINCTGSSIGYPRISLSDVIYFNGTSDYIQIYASHNASSSASGVIALFSGSLVSNQ